MKIFPVLCACLLLLIVPAGSRAATAPVPADATASEEADLPLVTAEFFKLTRTHQPPLSWRQGMTHGTLTVFPATPDALKPKEFRPLRSAARKKGDFYVVNVFAKGDPRQQPVYLYLLAKEGDQVRLVASYHCENGKARRIAG